MEAAGKTEEDVQLPSPGEQVTGLPEPKAKLDDPNWPLLTVSKSFFEGAFAAERNGANPIAAPPAFSYDDQIDNIEEAGGDWGADEDDTFGISTKPAEDDLLGNEQETNEENEEGGGWDMDDDIKADLDAEISQAAAQETASFVAPTPGTNESTVWTQNSPLAADHIAAGSFESAMQTLNRQVGVVNFEPLKTHFLSIYQASRIQVSAIASTPSLSANIRRNPEESNARASLPAVVFDFQNIVNKQLQLGYKSFTAGRLAAAATQFKTILRSVLFTVVSNKSEADEVDQLIDICREYIVGLALEQRRRTQTSDVKHALELAAYFTHCQLQTPHLQLALRQATKQAFKVKNFSTASQFARRLLELAPPKTVADEARQIQSVAERTLRDEIDINYDQYNPFVVCTITFEPIYKGSPKSECPFCHASYKPECEGKLCTVCEVSQIGANATGLRVMI